MISIVCVFDNRETLEAHLLSNLSEQTVEYELILQDDAASDYGCAARALNEGAKQASGDLLVFAHQDVRFLSPTFLGDLQKMMAALGDCIAGVAGTLRTPDGGGETLTSVMHGSLLRPAGKAISRPESVETLDECFLAVPARIFREQSFDEETCDDWHLYAADYCLSAAARNLGAHVLPLPLQHRSTGGTTNPLRALWGLGNLPRAYYRSLDRLLHKHRDRGRIHVTGEAWRTDESLMRQRLRLVAQKGRRYLGNRLGAR